ncbi:MAG TPA: protein-S-isoprenylcysteine O-methyltransferase [Bdellovibrionales bacterium]|nr:protein-S-isoprenylcysteine O-methyltransferase [Bdellovibrionales bacterium]
MDHTLSTAVFMPFLIAYFVVRGYWASKADKRPVKEDHSFSADKINIFFMSVSLILLPLMALFTSWLDAFDFRESPALIAGGAVLLAAGLYVFWVSHRDLGENWSVTLELKEGHSLVTNGIYAKIRHPMYLAIWLCSLGQALVIPNWVGGAAIVLIWGVLYFVRIGREEKMMAEKFGPAYTAYMSRTKRLLPYVV